MKRHQKPYDRHGLAIPEWFCILAFLAVGSLALWNTFGQSVAQYDHGTAASVRDPSLLIHHPAFGSATSGDSQTDEYANNGVGNGEDAQPPGDPPINDGAGTSPGDPGNQGGALQ